MLRAILIDFNGVLVDDEPIHFEILRQVLAEEDVEIRSEDYFTRYVGFDDRRAIRAVFEDAGREITPVTLTRLVTRKAAYYQRRVHNGGFPIFPGALELIRDAVAAGFMLGVVSAALRDEVESALDQLGLREHFKVLVTAEDVEESKPHPESYRRGLELLNSLPPLPQRLLHPHEVLAIEDTPTGLQSAAANALSTLGVAHTCPAAKLVQADHVITALADVTLAEIRETFARA